jgi:hypothetical protein
MIGVTLFGLFLTPVFYVVLMKLGARKPSPNRQRLQVAGPGAALPAQPPPPDGPRRGALFRCPGSTRAGWLTIGPDYRPPTNAAPAAFRDAPAWKEATPSDGQPKGPWWEVFNDAS